MKSTNNKPNRPFSPQRSAAHLAGFSLIELIVFIVIVGVGLAGILSVFNQSIVSSANPQIRKQALAIAESLMDEIFNQPFTFCDPDDAALTTAAAPANCATAETLGPEGETRGSATPFDNVNDYNGLTLTGISDVNGTPNLALSGYNATVTVSPANLGPPGGTNEIVTASNNALLITVTVTGPDNQPIVLEGYRTRYAPNSP